jgi:hypothetical protein
MRDLGLTYEQVLHAVQSAIRLEMDRSGFGDAHQIIEMLKYLRLDLDMRAADQSAIVALLIAKGVFLQEEYTEQRRLAANEELARRQRTQAHDNS